MTLMRPVDTRFDQFPGAEGHRYSACRGKSDGKWFDFL